MASTFSPLKVELIATGEQSGTWGTTTNVNLGTALGEAITGSADVTFASGDVTVTLTNVNTTQTARNLRLNLVGTSSGTHSLILGAGCNIEKLYLVNNTLANDITVVNTAGGTSITVPAGKSMFIYNTGTNIVDAVTHVSNASATTLNATNLEVTNLKAKDGTAAGSIANSTGVVTLNSSVLTTTDINGGTIDGTAVGATSRGTGAFTTLTANGATTLTAGTASTTTGTGSLVVTGGLGVSGRINAANIDGIVGANTAAAGSFTNLAYTGTLTGGTGVVNLGSGQVYKDASGNVGVGLTNPSTALQLNRAGSTETSVKFTNGGGASSGFVVGASSAGAGLVYHIDNQPILFATNNSERMRIDSAGNVGIGMSSPGGRLHVQTATSATVTQFTNSSGTSEWQQNGNDLFLSNYNASGSAIFRTNGTERMRIDSSGNVGIGTSSPNQYLCIGSDAVSTGAPTYKGYLRLSGHSSQSLNTNGGIEFVAATFGSGYGWRISAPDLGSGNIPFVFQNRLDSVSWTERMRIDASGNLLVGTTSANGKFTAETSSTTQRTVHAASASGSITTDGIVYSYTNTASGTGFNHFAAQSGSSGVVFRILGTGTAQNSTGTYTTISDAKLKENIVDIAPQLERLMNVRVVNYNLIGDELKQAGWIAQELETVYPKLVFETPDRDDNGEMNGEYTKGVKQSVFIPLLVKAIQELKAELDVVKAELNTIKGN